MEIDNSCISRPSRKRKLLEEEGNEMLNFSLDDLNEDLLERVLSWLPTSTFFRLGSVCRRWKSMADYESFKLACSRIPSRDPWLYMADSDLNHSIVFDSSERSWKRLNHPSFLLNNCNRDSIPVAASGGLICSRNPCGGYVVCNPVNGCSRELPPVNLDSLGSSGTIVACNLTRKCFSIGSKYSIDVVECKGEMLVVVLSEFFERASLRVWQYDPRTKTWNQIASMPPSMSHEFYDKKLDINCVGAGDQIFICLSSAELCSYILYDLATNQWVELPECSMNGEALEFTSAFSFEPRIEALV